MPRMPTANLPFPVKGLSERLGFSVQEPLTTVDCQNVRAWDPSTGRMRGASRPGHAKYLSSQPNGTNPIQWMDQVTVSSAVSGTSVRTQYKLAVVNGSVYSFTSSTATQATNGSGALTTSPFVMGAELFGVVYFADGTNEEQWTASTNTCATWTASAGSLPVSGSNRPRLICTWRGRIVLAGIVGDGHNWFMSRQGDATDFDYTQEDPQAAVSGNGGSEPLGKMPDVITALIPISDDLLLVGGDHSIYRFTNDPAATGGDIDLVTDKIGIAFGTAWCRDPAGNTYFFASRGGLWRLNADLSLERLSDAVEERLASVNLAATKVTLEWDDRQQCVLIYLTPTADSAGTHFAYDVRNGAWWRDAFATNGHQPYSVRAFDGDAVGDRVVILGCKDGYLRQVSYTGKNDDDAAIASYVFLGPIVTKGGGAFRMNELLLELGSSSNDVTYTVHPGKGAAAAYAATAKVTGTWTSSRTKPERQFAAGSHVYVKLANSTLSRSWQYEGGEAVLMEMGRVAGRSFR